MNTKLTKQQENNAKKILLRETTDGLITLKVMSVAYLARPDAHPKNVEHLKQIIEIVDKIITKRSIQIAEAK